MKTPKLTRYEVKAVVDGLMLPQIRAWLQMHLAGFYEAYPPRQVNNVYFDTPLLDSFVENLSGIATRRKMRLRWYGKDVTNIQSTLELKCKQNMHGWKVSQKLSNPLNLLDTKWVDLIATIHNDLEGYLQSFLDTANSPILINRYQREYYISGDGLVRVTLDYSQMVYDQRFSATPNLKFPVPPSGDMIIEFKTDSEYAQELANVLSNIPSRVSKSSKYTIGVSSLLGYCT